MKSAYSIDKDFKFAEKIISIGLVARRAVTY